MDKYIAVVWHNKVFSIGLVIKLIMVIFFVSDIQSKWFINFILSSIEHLSINPWNSFLEEGNDLMSYPYGPAMYIIHLPGVALGQYLDSIFGSNILTEIGFRLTLLLFDLATLFFLLKLTVLHDKKKIILYYWLSPIIIYAIYWHGQNDIIPVSLLVASLYYIFNHRPGLSGILIGLAVSAKLSMILAFPLLLIYLWVNKRLRQQIKILLLFFIFVMLFHIPVFISDGYSAMILSNPELGKSYLLNIDISEGLKIYIMPLVFSFVLYMAWRMRRINSELLLSIIGVGFFTVVLCTPASVGWFVWVTPFLAIHLSRASKTATILSFSFSAILIMYHLIYSSGATPIINIVDVTGNFNNLQEVVTPHYQSLIYTILTILGLILSVQMYRVGIQNNDYYHLGQKPLLFGVAGNFQAGIDLFSCSMSDLLGRHSVYNIRTEKYKRTISRTEDSNSVICFNPRKIDVFGFTRDVIEASTETGNMATRAGINSISMTSYTNDFIFVTGYYALYPKILLEQYDVKIFIYCADSIREVITNESRTKNVVLLDKDTDDSWKYLDRQSERADIVFRIQPVNEDKANQIGTIYNHNVSLKVLLVNGIFYEPLAKALIGVCGLRLDVRLLHDFGDVELLIEGDVSAEDLILVAEKLLYHVNDITDIQPVWHDGVVGLMQLITLIQLEQVFNIKRCRLK